MSEDQEHLFLKQSSNRIPTSSLDVVFEDVKFNHPYSLKLPFEDPTLDYSNTVELKLSFEQKLRYDRYEIIINAMPMHNKVVKHVEFEIEGSLILSYDQKRKSARQEFKLGREPFNTTTICFNATCYSNKDVFVAVKTTAKVTPDRAAMLPFILEEKWKQKNLGSHDKDLVKIISCNYDKNEEHGDISSEALCQISDVFQTMIRRYYRIVHPDYLKNHKNPYFFFSVIMLNAKVM